MELTPFTPSHRGGSGSPLLLVHGFTDTWRTWELVLPALEARHDVFAPTLAGHAGGPALPGELSHGSIPDAVERALDEAGIETAHIVGNSLGGFVALQLAARGRAKSVVALAPAGGWVDGDEDFDETLAQFAQMQELVKAGAPYADTIVSTPEGRRQATEWVVANYEHIPAELIAHQLRGAAECPGAAPLMEFAAREGWVLDAEKIECPVRMVWGSADQVLRPAHADARYRDGWVPQAEWVDLDGIGHMPQLDVPAETADLILGFTG